MGTSYNGFLQTTFQEINILAQIHTDHEICVIFFISYHDHAASARANNCQRTSKVGHSFLLTVSARTLSGTVPV